MTDAQLVTLATAFLAAVIAVLFNNSRISDLRNTMDKRFDDMNAHIDDRFALLTERLQRMEGNIMRITGANPKTRRLR
jgi:hypothetical protein